MKNICSDCKLNCCGKSFIGLASAFYNSNTDMFNQILLSDEEKTKIYNAGQKQYVEKKNNKYYLKLKNDRSCTAFLNGKCSIYDVRPNVCKNVPILF